MKKDSNRGGQRRESSKRRGVDGGMSKRKEVDPNAPLPERSSFDRARLERTSEESQKRLFQSRRSQARRKSKREKRQRALRTVILPAVFVSLFVLLIGFSVYKTMRSEREVRAKLDKAAALATGGGSAVRDPDESDESAGSVGAARDRYLMRENAPAATANEPLR